MNGELLNVLDYMEREKGIKREILIKAVETSLLSASRKSLGAQRNTVIMIEPKTGDIKVYNRMLVVETVANSKEELSVEEAKHYKADAKVGDEINMEITPKNFGRIAAQVAKQVIIQKIREAEKDIVFNEYREKISDLVTGIVRRHDRRNIVVDLGKCEAFLPPREQCPTEKYPIGSRIRAYVVDVRDNAKSLEVILSRTHPGLLRKLFELEVPEVGDGMVEIKAVAREPGFRSKVAVFSHSEKVDAVGACVGMRGERIKNIVRELNGEKIDIVPWHEEIATFAGNALSPAKPKQAKVLSGQKKVEVYVELDQLSLAIGRKGQNARLCAKLTGYGVDILAEYKGSGAPADQASQGPQVMFSVGESEEGISKEGLPLNQVHGLEEGILRSLKQTGYHTAQELLRLPAVELSKIVGLEEAQAMKVLEMVKNALQTSTPQEPAQK